MKNIFYLTVIFFSACMSPTSKSAETNSVADKPAYTIDHLILAINDLDKGITEFEAMTGVKPVYGGAHPHSFTHNALVSLGENIYLEIMAPRPEATNVPQEFKTYEHLTPVGWAIHSQDIQATERLLTEQAFAVDSIRPGARQKPDGQQLTWSTLGLAEVLSDYDPFFIQWGADSTHPSVSSPSGCTLQMVQWSLTKPARFKQLLTALTLKGDVVNSANGEDRLRISLRTPKGVANF